MSATDAGALEEDAASEQLLPTPPLAPSEQNPMNKPQAWNLYVSHFLSTWNIRTYEFAAVIFTAAAYPDTLSAAAIRGIIRTLASIALSSSVGRWVDHSPNRLRTLLSTITINRIAVLACCPLWFFIVAPPSPSTNPSWLALGNLDGAQVLKEAAFALILGLGIFENLSAAGNMLSMERDWVVTAASPAGQKYDLTHLNAVMRRIDLICKLIAPILISAIISVTNTQIGVLVVGAMSALSWGIEIFCARRVWSRNPKLRVLKSHSSDTSTSSLATALNRYITDIKSYFHSPVMIPSLSLSLLHLSALSYGATFITFLLSAGFSLDLITIARAVGSLVEISSTVITPVGVRVLGKAQLTHGHFRGVERESLLRDSDVGEAEERTETGLERLGLWGVTFQLVNLLPVVLILQTLIPSTDPQTFFLSKLPPSILPSSLPLAPLTLFTLLSLSRLGLWIFDLTTQQLTQTMVPSAHRSAFTGVEYSLAASFELLQHIAVIIFHRPEEFRYLALGSVLAVATSAVAYAGWVWKMRGHLVHWEKFGRLGKGWECVQLGRGRGGVVEA